MTRTISLLAITVLLLACGDRQADHRQARRVDDENLLSTLEKDRSERLNRESTHESSSPP